MNKTTLYERVEEGAGGGGGEGVANRKRYAEDRRPMGHWVLLAVHFRVDFVSLKK